MRIGPVTDDYSMLKEDVTFRKEVAEKVGIGFELPIVARENFIAGEEP